MSLLNLRPTSKLPLSSVRRFCNKYNGCLFESAIATCFPEFAVELYVHHPSKKHCLNLIQTGILTYSNVPEWHMIVKNFLLLGSAGFWLMPFITSIVVINLALPNLFKDWSILVSGYLSGTVYVFGALKSPHSLDLPLCHVVITGVVIDTSSCSPNFLSNPSVCNSSRCL